MNNPKIYTYSILYSTTEAFAAKLPYVTAVLEAEDGSRFASLLEGYQPGMEVAIGQEVTYIADSQDGKARYTL